MMRRVKLYESFTESCEEYVEKFKDKMSGSTEQTAAWWVDGTDLPEKAKKELWSKIKHLTKKESGARDMPEWLSESNVESKTVRLFENFAEPEQKGFELLTDERFAEVKEYFEFQSKEEAAEIEKRIKDGEKLYLYETIVDDDYEGFDGTDDYFDSEGHSWDVIEFISESGDYDIVAEADNSEGTYYTIIAKNNQ